MNSLKLLSTVTRHTQATKVFVRKINNQNLIPKVDFSWKEDKIIDTILHCITSAPTNSTTEATNTVT